MKHTAKEIELVGVQKLKEIENEHSKENLKEILLNAVLRKIEHHEGLKNDEAIQSMAEDIKALKGAYQDIMKACDIIVKKCAEKLDIVKLED